MQPNPVNRLIKQQISTNKQQQKRRSKMKNTFRHSIVLTMTLVLSIMLTSTAFAAAVGTNAGTAIGNTANITYSIGGVPQGPQPSTTATVVVDNLVDLSMTGAGTANVAGVDQAILFTIQNDGNEIQDYQVTYFAEGTADNTDMDFTDTNSGLYLDDGGTPGAYDGTNTLIAISPTSGTYYPIGVDIGPDSTINVLLVGTTPGGVTTGQTAEYSLVAQTLNASTHPSPGAVTTDDGLSADDPLNIDVVLADGNNMASAVDGVPTGPPAEDENLDGKYLASATYTFQGSGVTVSKSYVVLWDPINGNTNPKAIPGAYVTYTLVVDNANGSPAAILNQVTDTLTAALAIDPDLIDGTTFPAAGAPESGIGFGFKVVHATGRATTPATQYFTTNSDADGVEHAANLVTATFATILSGDAGYTDGELMSNENVTLTFNAIIQ
jgi:hypothetical protein